MGGKTRWSEERQGVESKRPRLREEEMEEKQCMEKRPRLRKEEMEERQGVEKRSRLREEEMDEEQGVEKRPRLRTEEMEEGHAEEHHDVMDQDVELNTELWANLPPYLIDVIIKKVLIGLPFSRVLSFCSACERWKDFLVSMEYLLYFQKSDVFMIFNPRTGLWESMPLLLSPADALRLQNMQLVSCDGGRLYFACGVREELIIHNPLTGRCSPTLTGRNAARLILNAESKTRTSNPSEWRLGWYVSRKDVWTASPSGAQEVIGNTIVASDKEQFQLFVEKQYRYGTPTVTLELKDSRSSGWVTVPDIDRDFHFLVFPTFLCEVNGRKSVMLGFYRYPGFPFNVIFYDIEERKCHWVWNVHSLKNEVQMSRQPLFATVRGGGELLGELDFLEFQHGGFTLARAPFPPPMDVLGKTVSQCSFLAGSTTPLEIAEMLSFVYMEQGHNAFNICLLRHSPRGPVNISVRRQNLVDGSQRISNWMECGPSPWESTELPSSRNFQILSPSLMDMPSELNIP